MFHYRDMSESLEIAASVRTVFMGTAPLAATGLRHLLESPVCEIVAAVTQPDRPKGRRLVPQPSAVKVLALDQGLPVLQPESMKRDEAVEQIRRLNPDLIIVAAYGQILPAALLEIPRHGCLNVHASLLPRYRGAAPIQRAILDDVASTGVTIMRMDEGLDTGDMLSLESTEIRDEDNAQTLHDRLAEMGGRLLVETLPGYLSGAIRPVPQPAVGATYARKIQKTEGEIDWSRPARCLWNQIRAFTPWPGASTRIEWHGKSCQLKIWQAAISEEHEGTAGTIIHCAPDGISVQCGDRLLRVTDLQLAGSKRLSSRQFLAGHPLEAGIKLG